MRHLLNLSRMIDALNERIGLTISWALLVAVLICAGNALVRYTLNTSSNAWLEIQWYLFGAIFLLAASYTLKRNEHVRIDVVTGRFSKRTQVWIDIIGFVCFMLPVTVLIFVFAWPYAMESIRNQEFSHLRPPRRCRQEGSAPVPESCLQQRSPRFPPVALPAAFRMRWPRPDPAGSRCA